MPTIRPFPPAAAALLLASGALVACGGGDSSNSSQGNGGSDSADKGGTTAPEYTVKKGRKGKKTVRGQQKGGKKTGISPSAPKYIGLFTAQVSSAEAKRAGFGTPGRWTLILGKGTYTVSSPKRAFAGSVKVSGGRMAFGTAKLPPGLRQQQGGKRKARDRKAARTLLGPCGKVKGVYRWSLTGKTLTFTRGRDRCAARRLALSKSWTQAQ